MQCGAAARRAGRGLDVRHLLPLAAVALLAVVGAYWLGSRHANSPAAAGDTRVTPAGPLATGAPPPLIGTPREQADRLFERIMQARARGDAEEVRFFLPMGLQAYQAVPDLDADGLFHLGLLHIEDGAPAAARASAARIEAVDDGHLFASALEAEAALAAGDTSAARRAFAEYLARFDAEIERALPEYGMHRPALDEYREQARSLTGA